VTLRGAERRIDVGELGGRLFVTTAGIGLDAEVAARFNARARGRCGLLPYLPLAIQALWLAQPVSYTIEADSERLEARALMIACANARQYGGRAVIAPLAEVDDGYLDVVVVEAGSQWGALWQARRLFTGTLDRATGVWTRRYRTLTITAAVPLRFHIDGEAVTGDPQLTSRIHRAALHIRVPHA
jgi:diacylglycerol kinase family enzyme